MRLETFEVKNFCGIKAFSFNAEKRNVCISGKNGLGKSTIKNAVHWLLQDCDSDFKSLNPKPLNEDGSEVHNVESIVEAVFDRVTLKKVFKEVWKKKRGSLKKHFSGHKSTYFVDDVPVSEAAYKATVAGLIGPDEAFRILLDPYYLPEVMKWQQRRMILLALSGDVDNEEIFKSLPKLAPLKIKMGDRTTSDHMKVLNKQLLDINKEIEGIPGRVDEVSLMMPDVSGLDLTKLKAQHKEIREEGVQNKNKIAQLESPAEIDEKRFKLNEMMLEYSDMALQRSREIVPQIQAQEKKIRSIATEKEISARQAKEREEFQGRLESCLLDIKEMEAELEMVEKWEFAGGFKCVTCRQELPEDQAREQFETRKSNRIDSLKVHLLTLAKDKADYESRLRSLSPAPSSDLEQSLKTAQADLESLTAASLGLTPEQEKLADAIENLRDEVETLRGADHSEEIAALVARNKEISQTYKELGADINKFETVSVLTARIDELTQQETTLAMSYEEVELEKFMLEEFIRARVNMLNDKVIRALDIPGLSVKMFDNLLNGGIKEICEFTFNGVPFQRVNRSQQIIVGLRLIEVMSKFYGVELPVLIDNIECVNELPEFSFQIIGLAVTNDKVLKVEVEK